MLLQVEHPVIEIDAEDDMWVASFCGMIKWKSDTLAIVFNRDDDILHFAGRPEDAIAHGKALRATGKEVIVKVIPAREGGGVTNEFLHKTLITAEDMNVIRAEGMTTLTLD